MKHQLSHQNYTHNLRENQNRREETIPKFEVELYQNFKQIVPKQLTEENTIQI